MSMDIKNGKVRLYNHSMSPVGFPSQQIQQGVFIRGRGEDEDFVVERVSFEDIEIENSKSDLFKVGRLRFHPDEEDEIYDKLGIEDKENIMNDKELIAFLSVDTIDNIKKISKIKSLTLISRMTSMLFAMERTNSTPPPHRISAVVAERKHGLLNGGKTIANSEINRILESERKQKEDDKLKETLEELKAQMTTLHKKNQEKEEESAAKDKLLAKSQSAIEDLLKKVEQLTKTQDENTSQSKNNSKPPKK